MIDTTETLTHVQYIHIHVSYDNGEVPCKWVCVYHCLPYADHLVSLTFISSTKTTNSTNIFLFFYKLISTPKFNFGKTNFQKEYQSNS